MGFRIIIRLLAGRDKQSCRMCSWFTYLCEHPRDRRRQAHVAAGRSVSADPVDKKRGCDGKIEYELCLSDNPKGWWVAQVCGRVWWALEALTARRTNSRRLLTRLVVGPLPILSTKSDRLDLFHLRRPQDDNGAKETGVSIQRKHV